jgi:methyl-accepting chemotaxis protein
MKTFTNQKAKKASKSFFKKRKNNSVDEQNLSITKKARFWDLIRGKIVLIFSLLIIMLIAMLTVSSNNLKTLQSDLKEFT